MDPNFAYRHHLAARTRFLAHQIRETQSPVILDELASRLEKVAKDIEMWEI